MNPLIGRLVRHVSLGAALVLVVSACGGDAGSSIDPTEAPGSLAAPGSQGATPDPGQATPDDGSPTQGTGSGETIVIGARQEHRITEAGASVSIRCDGGGEVYVLAEDVTATISGSCSDLDVERGGASIEAEAVNEIDINGSGNEVTATTVRDLDITGNDNIVDVDSVSEIDIEGSRNTVTYAGGNPEIDDEGTGNSISAR